MELSTSPWNVFSPDTSALVDCTKRKRGRPRKQTPSTNGKQKHNMDDTPANKKSLSHLEKLEIVKEFQRIKRQDDMSLQAILNLLAQKYKITYAQTHHYLSQEI